VQKREGRENKKCGGEAGIGLISGDPRTMAQYAREAINERKNLGEKREKQVLD
jgi:hypothetical protein